jgi:hypothetical protein
MEPDVKKETVSDPKVKNEHMQRALAAAALAAGKIMPTQIKVEPEIDGVDALYEISKKEEEEFEKKQTELENLKKMKAAEEAKKIEPDVSSVFLKGSVKKEQTQNEKEIKERRLKAMDLFKSRLAKNEIHAEQHKKAVEKPKVTINPPKTNDEGKPNGFAFPSCLPVGVTVPTLEDEIDPLDAFMAAEIDPEAEKKLKESRERAIKMEQDIKAGIDVGDKPEKSEFNKMAMHCFVCKQWGHTKKDCPNAKCHWCFGTGHKQKECPGWIEELVFSIDFRKCTI